LHQLLPLFRIFIAFLYWILIHAHLLAGSPATPPSRTRFSRASAVHQLTPYRPRTSHSPNRRSKTPPNPNLDQSYSPRSPQIDTSSSKRLPQSSLAEIPASQLPRSLLSAVSSPELSADAWEGEPVTQGEAIKGEEQTREAEQESGLEQSESYASLSEAVQVEPSTAGPPCFMGQDQPLPRPRSSDPTGQPFVGAPLESNKEHTAERQRSPFVDRPTPPPPSHVENHHPPSPDFRTQTAHSASPISSHSGAEGAFSTVQQSTKSLPTVASHHPSSPNQIPQTAHFASPKSTPSRSVAKGRSSQVQLSPFPGGTPPLPSKLVAKASQDMEQWREDVQRMRLELTKTYK
jgi:hypothetical protein